MPSLLSRVLVLLCLATPLASAQVPQLINFQGRVAVNGVNFHGSGQFKFALVNAAGAETYWSNDGTSLGGAAPLNAVTLPVANGLYAVLLGDPALANMAVMPTTVFNHDDVHLRIWFNDGAHGWQQLSPDQRIAAVGYAIMAGSVPDAAITAEKIAPGAVGPNQLAPSSVTADKLAPGQTVTGLNGLKDAVTLAAGPNVSLAASGNQITISAIAGASSGWGLLGNAVGGSGSFIGTTDNQPLDFRTNGLRALRLEFAGDSNDSDSDPDGAPNLVGGAPNNAVAPGIVGSVIAGGGAVSYFGTAFPQTIAADFASIAGGYGNSIQADARFSFIGAGRFNVIQTEAVEGVIAGGINNAIQGNAFRSVIGGGEGNVLLAGSIYSVIAGGYANAIAGGYAFVAGGEENAAGAGSFAAGRRARATHAGSFVWGDSTGGNFTTTANNQFLIRASGGVGIGKDNPATALDVNGTVTATAFSGSGANLTNISTTGLANGAITSAKIATGAIGTTQLAGGAVTSAILAPGAVGSTQLANGAVDSLKLAAGSVGSAQLAAGAVQGASLADGAIGTVKLADGAVTAVKIASVNPSALTGPIALDQLPPFMARLNVPQTFTASSLHLLPAGGAVQIAPDGYTPQNALLIMNGPVALNRFRLLLRGDGDQNHGLGWFGADQPFASTAVDGPVLFGFAGGALATREGGDRIALNWTSGGNVGVGATAPGERLEVSAPDATVRVRNTNDSTGAFLGQTYSTLQLGLYNPGNAAAGGLPANTKRSFLGIESPTGKVGSLTNTFGAPQFRNVLDDGAGNAVIAGNLTVLNQAAAKQVRLGLDNRSGAPVRVYNRESFDLVQLNTTLPADGVLLIIGWTRTVLFSNPVTPSGGRVNLVRNNSDGSFTYLATNDLSNSNDLDETMSVMLSVQAGPISLKINGDVTGPANLEVFGARLQAIFIPAALP